ncbi:MAG: tetratricopeptide repeat protein [Myxococcaceae bacterium]
MKHLERALPFLMFGFTALAFWPAYDADFVFVDDGSMIINNPHVYGGLTWESVKWAFSTGHWGMWMPLTWMSHQLDITLFGLYPEGPHAEGVLIHSVSAALAYLFVRKATGDTWRSLLVAMLFAVHPMRAESVIWVSERKDVLCMFFSLAALWGYAAYRKSPAPWRWVVVTVLYGCALMSKAQAIMLPFAMLLLDHWPLGPQPDRKAWVRRALEKAPWVAMALASTVFTLRFQTEYGAVSSAGWGDRLQRVIGAYGLTLWHTVWPRWLSYFYPRINPPWWSTSLSVAVLVALLAAAFQLRKTKPAFTVGILWFLGVMLPTTGVIQAGGQLTADRYSYLPHLGLFMGLVFVLPPIPERHRRTAMLGAFALVFGCVSALWGQAVTWNDSGRLYKQALQRDPDSPRTLMYMGMLELGQNHAPEAVELLERSAKEQPNDGYVRSNLARAYEAAGRHDDALAMAESATHMYIEGGNHHGFVLQAYGKLLMHAGRLEEAETVLRQAVVYEPDIPVEIDLARLFVQEHRDAEAQAMLEAGQKRFPHERRFKKELQALREKTPAAPQ